MGMQDKRHNWVVKDANGTPVDRVQHQSDAFVPSGGSIVWEPAPQREAFADYLAHGGTSD